MKLSAALLSVAVLLIGAVAPGFANSSSKQDVITSVSPGHITISRDQRVQTEYGKTKQVAVHTTYLIDSFTRAEVNGKRSEIGDLREGMLASVSGNLNTTTKERTATLIIARDRSVPSVIKQPRPVPPTGKGSGKAGGS